MYILKFMTTNVVKWRIS